MSEDRLGTLEDVAGAGSSPIVSVSVGTTGLNRAKLFHKRMSAMGCADRIQSMLIYDCNQLNINRLREEADGEGIAEKIILPEYVPFSEGFLRRVDQYEKHYGAIERDMENMVEKMDERSLSAGTDPQIILEWFGFGGHAMLSFMLHDIVVRRFPEACILPIICFPDDRGMHRNIREYRIWDRTQEMLGSQAMLLSDNRIAADYIRVDEALATALAAVEGCFGYEPSFGSLAETVSVLNITGSKWIAVEKTEIPVLNRKAVNGRGSKLQEDNHKKAMGKSAQKIKDRIFEIAEPENRFQKLAFFKNPGEPSKPGERKREREREQRIYVTMPLNREEVKQIREDIEDQLKREEFSKAFPGTQIAYAAGNPQGPSPENLEYFHIVKLIGLPRQNEGREPLSITSILDGDSLPDENQRLKRSGVKTHGQQIIERDQAVSEEPPDPSDQSDDAQEASSGETRTRDEDMEK